MSNIDQRVVEMQFDNKAFGSGVQKTLGDLENLKKGLKLDGGTKGINDVQDAAKRFNMAPLTDQVEKARQKIDVFRIFAVSAIYTVSSQLVHMAENVAKSLTIAPVMDGFKSYTDTINATQIIVANTKASGTTLKDVTASLATLQQYANQTVYSFSDMTQNIGRFTAAGVKLQPATDAIKGMANVAALSGANTEQMSSAMYQMSQALSAGVIKLQDWNSLSNANMAGSNIQEALKETARTMEDHGAKMDAAIKKQKNFRNSLTEGWLTADIYTKAMSVMGGTLDSSTGKFRAFSVEELKAKGYTDAAAKSLHQLSQDALNSAVQIRTLPQMMQALKEEVATAWGSIFKTVFGDINQATSLFTDLHNTMENALTGPLYAFNTVLQGWAKMGGRVALLEGLKMAFADLMAIITPIKEAFREIFPPTTSRDLLEITAGFRVLMGHLRISSDTAVELKRTFAGFFAILDIGWQLVKAGIGFIATLIGHFSQGTGGILKFTGGIGDFLVNLDKAIKSGNIFGKFFQTITPWIEKPVDALKNFVGFIISMVRGIAGVSGVSAVLDKLRGTGDALSGAGDKLSTAWGKVQIVLTAVWSAVEPFLRKVAGVIGEVVSAIGHFLSTLSFGDLVGAAGVGGIVVLIKTIRGAIDKFLSKDFSGGILSQVKESLEQLTGTLKSMQNTLKAATLLEIAAAIGILTIAVSVLSKIDAAGLVRATAAIAVMVVELTVAMALLKKVSGDAKGIKMDLLAAGMVLIAGAVDLLASAAAKLAKLDWNELAKGLTGVVVLLGAVAATMKLMPERSKMISNAAGIAILAEAIKILVDSVKSLSSMDWAQMAKGLVGVAALLASLDLFSQFNKTSGGGIANGIGIVLLATSIKILASAMADIAKLSWEDIAKGLTGIAGGLVAMTVALKLMPWGDLAKSASMVILAASLKILASAMKDMAKLSWEDIGKGLTGIAGGLTLIVVALNLMPWGNLAKATSLLIVSAALKVLASAMKDMGNMTWGEIARSLVELAGSLAILVVALNLLDGGLLGAAALVVVAAAIKILAGAMVTMGGMSWSDIAASLVELAGALTIIGVAVTLMDASLPGAAALVVVAAALRIIAPALQEMGAMSWSDIGAAIGGLAALMAVLAVGGALSPLIIALGGALVVLGAGVALAGAGIKAAGGGIKALSDGLTELSKINSTGIHNVTDALGALIAKIPDLIAAVAVGMVKFAEKIAAGASSFGKAAAALIDQFIKVISQKMPAAVEAFVKGIVSMLTSVAKHLPEMIQKGADIIVNFLAGIAKNMGRIAAQGTAVVVAFLKAIGDNTGKIADAGFKMIINVMNGIAKAIRDNAAQMRAAAANIGSAIIDGITGGLNDNKSHVTSSMSVIAQSALSVAKHILGIQSPSREFRKIGEFVVQGLVQGLGSNPSSISSAAQSMVSQLNNAIDTSTSAIDSNVKAVQRLTAARINNAHQLGLAQQQLQRAEAMTTTSNAKTAAARQAQIENESKAKDAAIRAAQERIRSYTIAQTQNGKDLLAAQQALAQSRNENAKEKAALAVTNSTAYLDEQDKLTELSATYDDYTTKINDANTALDAATKTRDDYNKSLSDQFGAQQAIAKDTQLTDYVTNLQDQIVATQNFSIAIQELRKQGLNDEMYKQLLSTGLDAMPFVQQLLAGGQTAVDNINSLGTSLDQAAAGIGSQASTSLYQAAVDSAAGLVKGLQDQQDAIGKVMDGIAAQMVNSIKKALGIKSPSKAFAEIGAYSADGLVQGLEDSNSIVSDSAAKLGTTAIDSMKKSISGLGDLISAEVDPNPVIAPVLDLTNFKKDASHIGSLLGTMPIAVGNTTNGANDAAVGYNANQQAMATQQLPDSPVPLTFIQNNTSPEALSSAEIYRQTNNQISVAKGALTGAR